MLFLPAKQKKDYTRPDFSSIGLGSGPREFELVYGPV